MSQYVASPKGREMNEQQDLFTPDARAVKLVDTREPGELRTKLIEVGWQQKLLFSADFAFITHSFQKVGITRKSTPDLLGSINEVWAKQLEEMLDYYDIRIILLEGSWSNIRPNVVIGGAGISYLTWDGVWNYLRRWQDKGFSLELTTSLQHTAKRLNNLYALYQKAYSLSAMTHKFADDRVLSMPSGTRGKTGQKVLDTLGSIQAVANAPIERLLEIEGIGQKKADLIFHHMRNNNARNSS